MKNLIILMLIVLTCSSCAAGAATAGYALRAKTCDELSSTGKDTIIQEAVSRCKEICK